MNVSLDSLKSDRVLKISQKDALKNTLEGVEESLKVGLKLKLNTVVVKSVNDDEILELLEYAKNRHIQIRYIEFMENTHAKSLVKGLKEREILDLIAQKYQIIKTEKPKQGFSKIYTLENGYQFGIIAPHSDDFCQSYSHKSVLLHRGVGHRRVGKIFIILNLFVKNKAVCLGFLVIVARIKQ
ncbi:hypothetical protein VN1155_09670 [Helicobacter pylori]|nr:hypothetical protein VN1155_09670 [Helicobacter pylori]